MENRQSIVVGAGPVGMVAALALHSQGIQATILEREEKGRERAGSRAIYIHKATLQLLEEICPGLGRKLSDDGIVWPVKRTLFRREEVYVRHYKPTNPHELPPFASLHQEIIEKHLMAACEQADIEFVWNAHIQEIDISHESVILTTTAGERWKADYVIGADGAQSVIRKKAGIEFEGPRTSDTFVVVDVKEDEANPLPLERIFHYQAPEMGGRNVMYVPFKGGWRVDLQLLEGDDQEQYAGIEGVKNWLPTVMDAKYAERITWVSTYQFYQVVALSYCDEQARVLLAGEAAHLFAPFGARGLNSGVPDAIIAARGMKKAIKSENEKERKEAILAAANERRAAGLYNRECSNIALHHIQGTSGKMNMKRELASFLSKRLPRLGRWLDEGPYGPRSGPPQLSTKY